VGRGGAAWHGLAVGRGLGCGGSCIWVTATTLFFFRFFFFFLDFPDLLDF
jgi:hypothetical protein